MGNLISSCIKKDTHNLILDKKCIHCGELFSTVKKRRKHEIICSAKNEDEPMHIYSDQTIYQS